MPAVKHIADMAFIDGHSLLNELRVCLKKLPSIILSLVCNLRLPGMNLLSPMLRVWLERRNLVRIAMSSHRHLNETLFNVLFAAISLSLHMVPSCTPGHPRVQQS